MFENQQTFVLSIIIICCVTSSQSLVRVWTGGTDAILESHPNNCNGLLLPETDSSVVLLTKRTMSEIVLPNTGGFALLDGARLTFDENDKSCTELSLRKKNLNRPQNWNALPNRAIPYLDRIPCQWDSIKIPSSDILGINSNPPITVKSVQLFGNQQTNENYLWSSLFKIKINGENACTKETCPCQSDNDDDSYSTIEGVSAQCEQLAFDMDDEPYCDKPILSYQNCRKICGAVMVFEENDKSEELKKLIQEILTTDVNSYYIDWYYGLVKDVGGSVRRQFVIVDKTPEGGGEYSKIMAKKIDKALDKFDEAYKVLFTLVVKTSGDPIVIGSFAQSGGGMLLITFVLTVLVFLVIYLVFMTPVKQFDLRSLRINPSNFRPFLFARFDNAGDLSDDNDDDAILRQRRVDISFRGEMAESAMGLQSSSTLLSTASSSETDNANVVPANGEGASLERRDRAFDNPLYDATSTPSSSRNAQTPQEKKVKPKKGKKGRKQSKPHGFEQLLRDDDDDVECGGDGGRDEERQEMSDLYSGNIHDERKQSGLLEQRKQCDEEIDHKRQPIVDGIHDEQKQDGAVATTSADGDEEVNRRQEMLKFIEENMQQVNLLDDQL